MSSTFSAWTDRSRKKEKKAQTSQCPQVPNSDFASVDSDVRISDVIDPGFPEPVLEAACIEPATDAGLETHQFHAGLELIGQFINFLFQSEFESVFLPIPALEISQGLDGISMIPGIRSRKDSAPALRAVWPG
jgi:hypothetical protein